MEELRGGGGGEGGQERNAGASRSLKSYDTTVPTHSYSGLRWCRNMIDAFWQVELKKNGKVKIFQSQFCGDFLYSTSPVAYRCRKEGTRFFGPSNVFCVPKKEHASLA